MGMSERDYLTKCVFCGKTEKKIKEWEFMNGQDITKSICLNCAKKYGFRIEYREG